jgi:hypothetical protein
MQWPPVIFFHPGAHWACEFVENNASAAIASAHRNACFQKSIHRPVADALKEQG